MTETRPFFSLRFFWEPDAEGIHFHLLMNGWIIQIEHVLIKWQFKEDL